MTAASTATAEPLVISKPGVYNIPAEDYHRDPVEGRSLSSTGARKLLSPSCPALFKHWQDNGEDPKPAWDLGSAAHKVVLGAGPDLVVVKDEWGKNPDDWRTDKVKALVSEVRAAGGIPLKAATYDVVMGMAERIREHPWAGRLFAPGFGTPEQAIVWRDAQTGVMCRALLDVLPTAVPGRRLILPDYKTAASAAPEKIERSNADFGYYVQLSWYLMGLRALGLADDEAQALLVVQMKEQPYLVTPAQPDPTAMRIGAMQCREALRTYAECQESGRWPGYADDEPAWISLPAWLERQFEGANA